MNQPYISTIDKIIDLCEKYIPDKKDLIKGILITHYFSEGKIYIGQEEDGKYFFINHNTWLQIKDQIETIVNDNPLRGIIGMGGIPVYEDEGLVAKFILTHALYITDPARPG